MYESDDYFQLADRREYLTRLHFWMQVAVTANPNKCWNWLGGLLPNGYGRFYPKHGVNAHAHRWAYEDQIGPIPKGYEIHHVCHNRRCVNPKHLQALTTREHSRLTESVFTINSRKQFCPKGHPLTPDNIVKWKWEHYGWRCCRICANEGLHRQYVRRKTLFGPYWRKKR